MSASQFQWPVSERFIEHLWDAWCIVSIIGIWPRFIEPSLLPITHHTLPLPILPKEFDGLRIVQISDLHHTSTQSRRFLERIVQKITRLAPDCILFTGDLLSFSHVSDPELLREFLSSLKAPLGVYAILGNHDYAEYVSSTADGIYRKTDTAGSALVKGLCRLFSKKEALGPCVTEPIQELAALHTLYAESGVKLLHNESVSIGSGLARIQLAGLGDIAAKQCNPQRAFRGIDPRFPTIVLSHNPDSYALLEPYPGDLLLFGHTHGGQVNLPFIWQKVCDIQDKRFKSGLLYLNNKFLYINRGLGSPVPFRWFAPPEIALFTLVREGPIKQMVWEEERREEKLPTSMYEPTSAFSNR